MKTKFRCISCGEYDNGCNGIEKAVIFHSLQHSQRDAHKIGEEKRGKTEKERDGKLADDYVPHRFLIRI